MRPNGRQLDDWLASRLRRSGWTQIGPRIDSSGVVIMGKRDKRVRIGSRTTTFYHSSAPRRPRRYSTRALFLALARSEN